MSFPAGQEGSDSRERMASYNTPISYFFGIYSFLSLPSSATVLLTPPPPRSYSRSLARISTTSFTLRRPLRWPISQREWPRQWLHAVHSHAALHRPPLPLTRRRTLSAPLSPTGSMSRQATARCTTYSSTQPRRDRDGLKALMSASARRRKEGKEAQQAKRVQRGRRGEEKNNTLGKSASPVHNSAP